MATRAAGALDLIAHVGGGTVEGYPEEAGAVPAGFPFNGALSTYERLGLTRDRGCASLALEWGIRYEREYIEWPTQARDRIATGARAWDDARERGLGQDKATA